MQNPSLPNVRPVATGDPTPIDTKQVTTQERAALWVSRVTSFVGLACLITALLLWALRQNHYRPVLAFLTIAMFAAILHSYTFEDEE